MSSHKFLFFIALVFINLKGCLSACPHNGIVSKASDRNTWPSGFDLQSKKLTLNFPLLLDVETPRYDAVTIVSGGRMVFSPTATLAKLVTDYVMIEDGGSLEIGSEDCPFEGKAEILLTGKRGSYNTVDGEKFISVKKGGSLEIHGRLIVPWTKLTRTVSGGNSDQTINVVDDVSSWTAGDEIV